MLVLDLIRTNPHWETELAAPPRCIAQKWRGNYVLLKYSQLESDFTDPIVRECRGCIFFLPDGDHTRAKLVCYPFDKFGNYGESYVPNIDWSTASVQEKVDGSLIKMWYHNCSWHISTNGTIHADEADTNVEGITFYDVVMNAIRATGDVKAFFETLNKNYTYMFELVSPETRVTIAYPKPVLYYLGARDMSTLKEVTTFAQSLNFISRVSQPKRYPLQTLEDCLEAVAAMGADEEGFVIRDKQFNRIKIKSPEYLIASRIRNNGAITAKHILELLRADRLDDFLAYAEDYKGFVDNIVNGYFNLIQAYRDIVAKVFFSEEYDIVNKRDLALQTAHLPAHLRSFLFALYDHKTESPSMWVEQMPLSTLVDLVKQYMVAA